MTKFNKTTIAFILTWAAIPITGEASITLEATRSLTNSIDLIPIPADDPSTELRFNQVDCIDNIKFSFKITETSSDDGDLYLVVGNDCTDTDKGVDDCNFMSDVSSGGLFTRKLRELLVQKIASSDNCSGTSSVSIWAARLPSTSDRVAANEHWSSSIKVAWDMDPPNAPQGLSSGPGDGKVQITWQADDSADAGERTTGLDSEVTEVRIIYTDGSGIDTTANDTSVDDTADSALDGTDTPDGGNADSDSSVAADSDTAGTAISAGRSFSLYGATEETASTAECPTNGFQEGDSYVPGQYDEVVNTTPSSGETTVTGLENSRSYKFGTVALDEYKNSSPISETVCDMPGKTSNFLSDYIKAGGKSGKFCFAATAAFGSYDHPVVKILRRFRDNFLAPMPGGQTMIEAYYRVGPSIAAVVVDHPMLRSAAKGALFVIAVASIPLSSLGPLYTLLLCTAIFGVFAIRRKLR